MTKTEMVKKLADDWGGISSRQADDTLAAFITFITKTVKKDKVLKVPNLGTFRLRQLKARTGRNPQTGEAIRIRARKKVAFTPSKAFKEGILGAPRTAAKKSDDQPLNGGQKNNDQPLQGQVDGQPVNKTGAERSVRPPAIHTMPIPVGYSPGPA
jgi:DNA-binding protein HU-beta